MPTTPERWELGSDLHRVPIEARSEDAERSPWELSQVRWSGAGRDGIRLILEHGSRTRGWRRCWLPSYLCQEVVAAARSTGLDCKLYSANPLVPDRSPELDFEATDVLMVVHQFGLHGRPDWLDSVPASIDSVEDHTHDPWSDWARTSDATYAFASLRKTLPLAEGTPVWSPTGAPLPPEPQVSSVRARAVALKDEGMSGKADYLAGGTVTKDAFRAKLLAGEAEIASGPVSGITDSSLAFARSFPVNRWRAARLKNAERLRAHLQDVEGVKMLDWAPTQTPFAAILVTPDRGRRDALRTHLIASSVYPAILWPLEEAELEGISELDRDLADRLLSIHCDGRYTTEDMDRLAAVIAEGIVG